MGYLPKEENSSTNSSPNFSRSMDMATVVLGAGASSWWKARVLSLIHV